MEKQVAFGAAFRFWLKLGFVSFGGPAGQIAIMQRELVEQKKWIDQDDFLHALNYCMLLPGPEAQQLATYIGWRLHGIRGGIVAGAFFVIPSIFFLLMLSHIYAAYGNLPQINAILDGFKAVVVAIVVEAVFKIAKKAFKTRWHIFISILSFAAIYFLRVPFPLIILSAAVFGVIGSMFNVQSLKSEETIATNNEQPTTNKFHFLKVFSTCFALWLLPFSLLILFVGFDDLLVKTNCHRRRSMRTCQIPFRHLVGKVFSDLFEIQYFSLICQNEFIIVNIKNLSKSCRK